MSREFQVLLLASTYSTVSIRAENIHYCIACRPTSLLAISYLVVVAIRLVVYTNN